MVIAHRLSTIHNADKIFVLKNGNVLDSGNHEFFALIQAKEVSIQIIKHLNKSITNYPFEEILLSQQLAEIQNEVHLILLTMNQFLYHN